MLPNLDKVVSRLRSWRPCALCGKGFAGHPCRVPRVALLFAAIAALLAFPGRAVAATESYIVVYERTVASPAAETARQERARGFRARFEYGHAVKGFSARLAPGQVEALRSDADVAAVLPDRPVYASEALAPGEPLPPTGVRRVRAATADTVAQSGAAVAVVDTGIDLDHPDLDAVDAVDCITPGTSADDDDGHGTHVAGTIGARNDGSGVVGVAPGTRLFAVKVLDASGKGTTGSVLCGLDWVAANAESEAIAVANMSLGADSPRVSACSDATEPMHVAVCGVVAAGVLPVVAAGNEAQDFGGKFSGANQYWAEAPAVYPQVLTVTAIADRDGAPEGLGGSWLCSDGWSDTDDTTAPFSNYATRTGDSAHTIAAPGLCITSTAPGGGLDVMSGTSMASPHVAGAVARCVSQAGTAGPCAGMTPAEIVERMRSDASAALTADTTYGFTQPAGRVFGPLVVAGPPSEAVAPTPPADPDPGDSELAPTDPPPTDPPALAAQSDTNDAPATMPAPLVIDTTAPSATVAATHRRLRTLIRTGLPVAVRCGEDCRVRVRLVVSAATARRLGLKPGKPLARAGSPSLGRGLRFVLRPGSEPRRRLRAMRTLRAKVVVTVTDAAGNADRVTRRLTLRR